MSDPHNEEAGDRYDAQENRHRAEIDALAIDFGNLRAQRDAAVARAEKAEARVRHVPHPNDVDLAIRANNMGGREFKEDYCQCDASVGVYCPYCAIYSVLDRLDKWHKEAAESQPPTECPHCDRLPTTFATGPDTVAVECWDHGIFWKTPEAIEKEGK